MAPRAPLSQRRRPPKNPHTAEGEFRHAVSSLDFSNGGVALSPAKINTIIRRRHPDARRRNARKPR